MRRSILILVSLTLLFCGGCAIFNRDNTPTLNLVERHLVPKEQTARLISAPLVVPIGFAAATLDMVLFHPISVAGDAWDDTNDLLWKNLDWDRQFVTTTVLNAPRAVAVPIVFTTDFLARSSFDISRRGGDIRLNKGGNTMGKDSDPAITPAAPYL
ncbi:MAG: hypothetical protein CXR30_13815 [Geobacter sp.]|nr:MAG: hypothetical protein CXR30_13815 [Geobacter sp.]